MTRHSLWGLLFAVTAAACTPSDGDKDNDDLEVACEVSTQCPVGQMCEDSLCVEFGCVDEDCGVGEFCDPADFTCKPASTKCLELPSGCECLIADAAGRFPTSGAPTLTLATGGSLDVHVVLAGAGGGPPVPAASFSFEVGGSGASAFSVNPVTGKLTATSALPGIAKLTAKAGLGVECEANLVNQGAPPSDGNVRFYVYDDTTGAPIGGAVLVVDTNGDGVDDGVAPATDAAGLALTRALAGTTASTYAVTAFRQGYNHLSVVGLQVGRARDVALPMLPRSQDPDTGGFTGKINFQRYEEVVLGGLYRSIMAGLVGSSVPLKSVMNFDSKTFIGPITDEDCTLEPMPQGCYRIKIGEFLDMPVPLPGGVVVGLQRQSFKDSFEVVGPPGRRYAWGLGTEVEIGDLARLYDLASAYLVECACDVREGVCDFSDGAVDCDCDIDCGVSLDFGKIQNRLTPLIPGLAFGARGNLPLAAASMSDWETHIGNAYAARSADERFPRLDDERAGDYGRFEPIDSLRHFVSVAAPLLPLDPGGAAGERMDGMLLVSGVDAVGYGFVPMGLGVGVDCTKGNCMDREGNAGGFDGIVNGATMCIYDPDPLRNGCPPGVAEATTDGNIGLFRAAGSGGLADGDWLTLALAIPVTNLLGADYFRAALVVVRGKPAIGSDPTLLRDASFAPFPQQPANVNARTYDATETDPGLDGHWVTFATSGAGMVGVSQGAGVSTRWNVFFAPSAGPFKAPATPIGAGDPFAPSTSAAGDIPAGHVNVTHVGFRLRSGFTFDGLAANNGTSLSDMANLLESLSVQSRNLPAH